MLFFILRFPCWIFLKGGYTMVKILEPLYVKGLEIKNRMLLPPMAMGLADENGLVTENVIEHYRRMASLGLGTIILEHHYVDIKGKASKGQLSIDKDECIQGLSEIANIIHNKGGICGVQINHAGSFTTSHITGYKIIAPSPLIHPKSTEIPEEMSIADINHVKKAFRNAARRVKKAGFDFVEIHGCHGYLINQFLSPLTNARLDEYGGIRANRIKFALEIVQEIREEVGDQFVIFYRIAADDNMENGITIDDAKYLAVKLVEAGVDVLDVSQGLAGSRPVTNQQGFFVHLAEGIKSVVNIPVITTGGITDAKFAYHVIKDGKADLVGIGRAILDNEDWVSEALQEFSNIDEAVKE